ncbi:cytochrome c biogenesis heme-transporting ATPase CcmA [Ramlibacter sp.]|uniref:cytochrome c biogenesis heme-transporting ATPase CcmA n=1 Tax=Ramlibacter sp. TaxID=1917967 RepID=UPI003D0BCCEB
MLSVQRLACVRGERPLFAGVGFTLQPGEWAHVRGANGSGKTSLLRILAGLSPADEGEVLWNGTPIGEDAEAWRRDMLYLGHHSALKEELTGLENLQFAAQLDGCALPYDRALAALARFGLAGREDLPVRVLSAGQKRRVLLARTVTRPHGVWILDEPFTALDARAVDMLTGLVSRHLDGGGMAVITSHQAVPLEGGTVVEL